MLPLVGQSFQAIAMDTVGFGDSAPRPGVDTIEGWADAAAELLDHLGIAWAHVVGHHTGGVIAVALAAAHPGRVGRLVLSSTPYTNPDFRRARAERPPIDGVRRSGDGSWLADLWRTRQAFYPADRPELLEAFVLDALKAGPRMESGHGAVGAYRMEDVIADVQHPTLVVRATDDPFAAPHAGALVAALPDARVADIDGGMVPLPDQLPHAFATTVLRFLQGEAD